MKESKKFYESRMEETYWPPDDLCDPPTPAQVCVNVLIDNILGEDWYVVMPEPTEQINTVAVHDILEKWHNLDQLVKRSLIANVIFIIVILLLIL